MRNDLREAVAHLEAMAQNAIGAAADADMPEQQKTALWAEYKALDTALTALCEKQQREAGCEWCTKLTNLSYSDASYYDDIRACVGMQKDIHILERHKKDDYVLNISSHAGNWIDYPIHYCPMCGRRLSGNTEQVKEGGE